MEYTKNLWISAVFSIMGMLLVLASYKEFHSKTLAMTGFALIASGVVLASYADYLLAIFGGTLSATLDPVEVVEDAVLRRVAGEKYIAMSILRIVPPEIYYDMSLTERNDYLGRISSLLMSLKEPGLIGALVVPADLRAVLDQVRVREAQIRNMLADAKKAGDEHGVKTLEDERRQIRGLIQKLEKEGAVAVMYIATVSAEGFTKELALKNLNAKRQYFENNIRTALGAMYVAPLRGRILYRVYQILLAVPTSHDIVLSAGV